MAEILGPLPITKEDQDDFEKNPGKFFVDYKNLQEPVVTPEESSSTGGDYDTV